ncbi:MAG TPA: hypothetical protein VEZ11_12670 [Thermoanaerobaculia bacterium]|nr:hypothetical protein [Thermoanaerobaculia bacterium]
MRQTAVYAFLAIILLTHCGSPGNQTPLSKAPVSIRGWITDVEGDANGPYRTVETEASRRAQLFQATTVYVDGAPYVSGGVAENGAFLLLDVPPGNVTLAFTAPGAPESKLVLQNIPGNADVFVPNVLLTKAAVRILDPAAVAVRLAAKIDRAKPAGLTSIVAGLKVPVMQTPIGQMTDRHDFPNPPGMLVPLARVK